MTDIQFDRLRNSLTVEDCGEAGFPELFCVSQVNTLWGSFEINNVKLMKTMLTQFAKYEQLAFIFQAKTFF